MIGLPLFPTEAASGGVFFGPVVDPVIAWAIVGIVLAVCCRAIWVVGDRERRVDDGPSPSLRTRETKKAA